MLDEQITALTVDASGYVYAGGTYTAMNKTRVASGITLPSTMYQSGMFMIADDDGFLIKLSSTGTVVWAKRIVRGVATISNGFRQTIDSMTTDGTHIFIGGSTTSSIVALVGLLFASQEVGN